MKREITKREFTLGEAKRRARLDYGLYPYEPDRPCKILGSSVSYRCCRCGFETTSSAEIYDHISEAHGKK